MTLNRLLCLVHQIIIQSELNQNQNQFIINCSSNKYIPTMFRLPQDHQGNIWSNSVASAFCQNSLFDKDFAIISSPPQQARTQEILDLIKDTNNDKNLDCANNAMILEDTPIDPNNFFNPIPKNIISVDNLSSIPIESNPDVLAEMILNSLSDNQDNQDNNKVKLVVIQSADSNHYKVYFIVLDLAPEQKKGCT